VDLLGLTPTPGLLAELTARYAEPHRAYHTMQHIAECFTVLEPAEALARRLGEVMLDFATRLEARARQNLRRSLAQLGALPASP